VSTEEAETRPTRRECEAKYAQLRAHAFTLLEEEWLHQHHQKLTVTRISENAIDFIDEIWAPHPARPAPWDWKGVLLRTLRTSHPRRFEVALWADKVLCGVAIGRLSQAKEWVSVTFVEGNPDSGHPLKGKVLAASLLGARLYAALMERADGSSPAVRVLNPLTQVLPHYHRAGYTRQAFGKGNGRRYCYCFA
jgi:hypothetical protein